MKKFLFDYEQLSPIERNILSRAFPFYKWINAAFFSKACRVVRSVRFLHSLSRV